MAKATQSPAVAELKTQAERLNAYLETIGRKVTSQQALEAVCRAAYGRPYNTVKPSLGKPKVQDKAVASPLWWYHDEEFGDLMPVTVSISLYGRSLVFGTAITAYVAQASIQDLKDFLQLAWLPEERVAQGHPRPWFLEQLMAEDSPFATPHTVDEVRARPTAYTAQGILAFVRAFQPERYLETLKALFDGSQPEGSASLHECEVNEDPDQPGMWLWVCREPFDASDISYATKVEAELALADAWLASNPELFSMQERLKHVKAGSGVRK